MPQVDVFIQNRHYHELNPLIFGSHDCPPFHSFGFATRSHCLIHYVVSGKGKYILNGTEYDVNAGQIFIIPAEKLTKYYTESDPWSYIWIGFDGSLANKFYRLPPVMNINSDIFLTMLDGINNKNVVKEDFLTAKLFELYSLLFYGRNTVSSSYTQTVMNFIENNYMSDISVEAIASGVNLDRRYLSRIFKRDTGKTLREYITEVRLAHATMLLGEGYSVRETASLIGYADQFSFSKAYKKAFNKPPKSDKRRK